MLTIGTQTRSTWRFAPSPNGYLHLGHALSALRNWRAARLSGGRFLLRIENIDLGRCRPEYEKAIFEDLAWLGLEWEEPVRRQSDFFDDYTQALKRLGAMGLTYPCFCTRRDIACDVATRTNWPHDPDGAPIYPGMCRTPPTSMRRADRPALRLNMALACAHVGRKLEWREYGDDRHAHVVAAHPQIWGDVVVGRRDIPASYHIAVVLDDALQGVTDVMRGMDLFHATSIHRLLQTLFDLPAPAYHHHALIRDDAGLKLSKSACARSLRDLRRAGATPADIRRMVGLAEANDCNI